MMSRKDSIYFRLARLIILAAATAIAFYWILNVSCEGLITDYFDRSGYAEKQSEKKIEDLQKYVEERNLKTTDSDQLTDWVRQQDVASLQIYRKNRLTYDSNYPDEAAIAANEAEYDFYDWQTYYTMQFADGEAEVLFFGYYEYQLYNYARTVELLLAFVVFLLIVMLGIRGTMEYISRLSSEIKILEGGDLDYNVTVKGRDELSVLAHGLDDMRRSFRQQAAAEAYLTMENRRIITEMSHDLRTPLTSILLYVEILQNRKCADEEQLWDYLERISAKAHQMKQLADNIFQYALVSQEKQLHMTEPEYFQMLLYDQLSGMATYLEQNGFCLVLQELIPEVRARVDMDYLNRIFDNITSNIVKYATEELPVVMTAAVWNQMLTLSFQNGKKPVCELAESFQVGLQNVKRMMTQMEGDCRIVQDERYFSVQLLFPVLPDERYGGKSAHTNGAEEKTVKRGGTGCAIKISS